MDERTGPLAGLRVIELGGIGPAPFGGLILADMGADVLRFERPGAPANPLNRGKRIVVLNLKDASDAALALDLISTADVVLEGFRPGAMERAGFGPEALLAKNPRLVYGRVTGWGGTGPLAETAGHDINYLALTGALHAIGTKTSGPVAPLNLLGDFGGGGAYLAIGILAALRESDQTGAGQVVDAAIVDGVSHLMSSIWGRVSRGAWNDERESNQLDGGAPYYAIYETADRRHMAVGAIEPAFYRIFLDRLGLTEEPTELQDDRDRWPALKLLIAARFREATLSHWTGVFWGTDACVSPVRSLSEAAGDPHLAARGSLVVDGPVTQAAPAPRFSGHPNPTVNAPQVLTSDLAWLQER